MKILVTENGIIPNISKIQTKELQEIINNAPKGTILVFPKGTYVLSTVYLKSDLTIELKKDCTIFGAPSFYDYDPQEKLDYPLYQDASHSYFNCSMFVGKNISNISIIGKGTIDMRSVWDEDNVRDIVHRGPKCIALRECNNVTIKGIKVLNVTDLAIYFAGCNNVDISDCYLKVYIDGISPDNSKYVKITNCNVESGDDGIVLKSSYTLNRLDSCNDIKISSCNIRSRCNAIKFGTESNGGFYNIDISDITISDTRISGIAIESVDGAIIDNVKVENITMRNVNAPLFVHLGKRLRGPQGTQIGSISNISFKNIVATGPYVSYKIIPWNYISFINKDYIQEPWNYDFGGKNKEGAQWQFTSNICGLRDHYLKNISLENIIFELDGGCQDFPKEVPEEPSIYPEVNAYGKVLPCYGIYFRNIEGLKTDNIIIKTIRPDARTDIIKENIK